MESMDNFRERFEALEAHIHTVERRLRWWWGIACTVILVSLVGLAHPSHAVDFACTAGDVACLIAAINTANANGETTTITLEAGTYTLTAVDNTTDGPNGLPSVTSPLTIQGAGADTTVIERAPSAPPFRLGHIAATGVLTLTRLTLRGGGGSPSQLPPTGAHSGGGLFNHGGILTLATIFLIGNRANGGGGGLFASGGTVTIVNSTIDRNEGGPQGGGGGLNIENGGVLSLIHSKLTNNSADTAGGLLSRCGLRLVFPSPSLPCGTVTIIESTIANNFAQLDGGISNFGGTLTILKSAIVSNSSFSRTGGLANSDTAVITNTTISNNRGIRGGGISNTGTLIITNATIAHNSGGGVFGEAVMVNTILAQNTARLGPDCTGTVTSLGTNLIGDPAGCTITLLRTDLTGDPALGDFTDNDTPGNGHFPLRRGSPAIDAGNDAFCPPTDQLGRRRVNIRKVGTSICDIGAIEFHRHDKDPAEEAD